MATTAEYANLAQAAYDNTSEPDGWKRIATSPVNDSGYQGAAFQRIGTNEIVLANRGTEPTQSTDLLADLQMVLRQVPDQYHDAQNFLQQVMDANNGANISITGHSLGGALSQLLGANTGLETVTFNPYGAKQLAEQLGIDPSASYQNIHNNQTQFDPVSRVPGSGQLGDMTTLAASTEWPAMALGLQLGLPGVTAVSLRSHLIDRFTKEIFNPNQDPSLLDDLKKTFADIGKDVWNKYKSIDDFILGQSRRNLDYYYSKQENRQPDPSQFNTYRIEYMSDPLALDLDGDGLETAAVNGYSGALFDHNNDGIKTATGWIKGDDGLLVRDLNGNGTIDSGAELFGDSTLLANGTKAANGFAALRDLDINGDGKVDANDAAFSELKIWRDINQDGISQADELKTLTELGIQSLNTATANTPVIGTSAGAQILTGSFTRTDGTTSTLADINLIQDNFHSEYANQIEIPEALQNLPNLQGMGRLRDLREAAALSPALASVLSQFAVAETRTEQKTLIDQLLLEWAKTDPKFNDSRIELFSLTDYSLLTYSKTSTNVIYLRRGQSLPNRIYIPYYADTQFQHRTHILDSVYGDQDSTRFVAFGTQVTNINTSYEYPITG